MRRRLGQYMTSWIRLGCSLQQFSTYKNETSEEKGMLASRPVMLKIRDFALQMVSYEAYLSLHLFGAEFILDGGPYRLKCSLISTSCCERQQWAPVRILECQHCLHLFSKTTIGGKLWAYIFDINKRKPSYPAWRQQLYEVAQGDIPLPKICTTAISQWWQSYTSINWCHPTMWRRSGQYMTQWT